MRTEMLIEATPASLKAAADEHASDAALNHLKEQAQRLHGLIKPGISKQSAVAASKSLSDAIDALTFQ